jgi:CRP/FNR family transcriptional regulator, cyclic AMP receptor protein
VPLPQGRKIELLATVPLFSNCSKRDLAAIARLAHEVELPAGHTLIRENARVAYSFFVLIDGEAEVRRGGSTVAALGPGDFFGELALILRRPRTATVTLTAPSRLLSISAHNFHPLLMSSPAIQFKLLEAVAERLEARDQALVYA